MLRRTLQCLLEKEGFSTLKRAVMAKARPNMNNCSERAREDGAHRNGLSGSVIHRIGSPDTNATPGVPAPAPAAVSQAPHSAAPAESQQTKEPHGDVSEDAYRFLLHHIDSEIAALKRRVTTVGKLRENVEDNQNRRIREIFECIERPWLLLESIPAPQLPNRAFDVFAKEQYVKYRGCKATSFEQDAVFLDACRRNWRTLSALQRKPYEIAARRNENLRRELKKKVANGCTHFESFCEQAREWTADLAQKEGKSASAGKHRTIGHGKSSLAQEAMDTAELVAVERPRVTATVASKKALPEARLASTPSASAAFRAVAKNPTRRRCSYGEKGPVRKTSSPVKARASVSVQRQQRQQQKKSKAKVNRTHGTKQVQSLKASPSMKRRQK